MPPLENWKHEKFAQVMANTDNASEAYKKAYDPKDIHPDRDYAARASHLRYNPAIIARIKEIQQRAVERTQVKREDIISFLRRYIEIEFDASLVRPSDALKAAELLSKMCGFNEPERLQVGVSLELSNVLQKLRGNGNNTTLLTSEIPQLTNAHEAE